MPRFDITQTDLAAVADPDEVVLLEGLDDGDLVDDALPAPPRALRVDEVGSGGERRAVRAVVGRSAQLSLEVPASAARMVVLALDGDGQVIASRDLPIENQMAAELFLELVAAGLDGEGQGAVDLHVRLTPELAAALAAAARKAKEERGGPRPLPTVRFAALPRGR